MSTSKGNATISFVFKVSAEKAPAVEKGLADHAEWMRETHAIGTGKSVNLVDYLAKRFLINVALIVLSITLLGCASRQTEIIIPASPDKIWTVLIDTDGYKEWNPVFVPLKGRLEQVEEGEILTWLYTQRGQDPIETEMKVVKFVKHKQLNQQGGIWGILNVNHNWFLDPVPEGTRVTNREEWSGIGVLFWDYSWVEPTYKEMNENLKKQVLRTR